MDSWLAELLDIAKVIGAIAAAVIAFFSYQSHKKGLKQPITEQNEFNAHQPRKKDLQQPVTTEKKKYKYKLFAVKLRRQPYYDLEISNRQYASPNHLICLRNKLTCVYF